MKKFGVIASALFVLALSFSSCKTHERCPAYGNVDVELNDDSKA